MDVGKSGSVIGHDAKTISARLRWWSCLLSHPAGQSWKLDRGANTRLVPVVRRAEMLAELMRLKCGRSPSPAPTARRPPPRSIAALLDAGGFDPTVINGGIINAYGTNAQAWGRATGWWSRRTSPTAVSSSCRPTIARGHQHRSGAPRPSTATFDRREATPFSSFVRERSLLRVRRHVHRSSRSPGDDRPDRGSTASLPMVCQSAGRRAVSENLRVDGRRTIFESDADRRSRSAANSSGRWTGLSDADVRANTMSRTPLGAIAVAHRPGNDRRGHPFKGLKCLRRRQATFHQAPVKWNGVDDH